jgi:glycosyltransferase involved in cell wall biosynthesis
MRIFIDGKDNLGWSLDNDRKNIQHSLQRLNVSEVKWWEFPTIIHNICWNSLLDYKKFYLRFKENILVTASNFVDLDTEKYSLRREFERVNTFAKGWIVPSSKQKKIFESHAVRAYYQPFYIDLHLFTPLRDHVPREELLKKLGIPADILKDKVIIGSFQRDTEGADLRKPKWQKGPELLIEALRELPKERFLVLLAGPRRHYVIQACRKYAIPYYYLGQETSEDDIRLNMISVQNMPYLYAITDLYLVTSVSEGGPKAILEATATKTCIFSTDVGLAGDFLEQRNIFRTSQDYTRAVYEFVTQFDFHQESIQHDIHQQYLTCTQTLQETAMDQRLLNIYTDLLSAK